MSKLCECGCGQPAPIAKSNDKRRGWIKGQPIRFISGHNGVKSRDMATDAVLMFCACGCGEKVKRIPLTQGKVATVSEKDYAYLSQFKWFTTLNYRNWYAARKGVDSNGKQITIWMHRVILDAPADMQVDHRDLDGLNNHRHNLRLCTPSENRRNRLKLANNTSGYKGVFWIEPSHKWQARIALNGFSKSLGYFNTAEDAARAYDVAAPKYHGEFASVNIYEEGTK